MNSNNLEKLHNAIRETNKIKTIELLTLKMLKDSVQ